MEGRSHKKAEVQINGGSFLKRPEAKTFFVSEKPKAEKLLSAEELSVAEKQQAERLLLVGELSDAENQNAEKLLQAEERIKTWPPPVIPTRASFEKNAAILLFMTYMTKHKCFTLPSVKRAMEL